jgi:Amt family ammonium transporter
MKRFIPIGLILFILVLSFIFPGIDVHNSDKSTCNAADTAWMLTATALVLIMTPGLAFFYGGMVNKKNVISTMLQSIICMVIVTVMWVVFGFSLAFGDSIGGFIGNPKTFFMLKGHAGQ